MWQDILVALCLVFVIEGIMPFISPRQWRRYLSAVLQLNDHQIRMSGLFSMLLGTAVLYVIH
jgi:uncharacterized protein YjeT (DUF2065 family)